MPVSDPHDTLGIMPELMTVAALRAHLEPYGTMHRRTMKRAQLIDCVRTMQANLRKYGRVDRPAGVFEDGS